ncbi:hypothetical protein [Streptomyces sp. NBC_01435]|uniref:hypothetical protein n=1 Tax=Streptomyces sp. NBC_01435 TaxID=2903865 RepID=UPI002E3064DF|nr:hypothetical protein [Streptomyces sp. NBC_01435]
MRAAGLRLDRDGRIVGPIAMFAKASRPDLAEQFMGTRRDARAPGGAGWLMEEEAAPARRVPVAEDLMVEADSTGHTDRRVLGTLLPPILALRVEMGRPAPADPAGACRCGRWTR